MKILVIADVHHRLHTKKENCRKTLAAIKKVIQTTPCDLVVFLGDIVHGPDFQDDSALYERYLREVLDITGEVPFCTEFGNHDDECAITKEEILSIVQSYPNALTRGRHYVTEMMGETLLFIDSGSYYNGKDSYYDVVDADTIQWAKEQIKGKKAVLFQHIIVNDIMNCIEKNRFTKKVRFKDGIVYTGTLGECPCPPDINSGELAALVPYLKGAVFAHDHKNDFELDVMGVRLIQCPGAGFNSYEKRRQAAFKLLDTETMHTETIFI